MTYAPQSILDARQLIRDRTDLPWVSLGIVGDKRHTGGYHCGDDRVDADDYSVDESPRDARGLTDAASALDVGRFDTGDADLIDMSLWIVAECEAGAPDTRDIREVIYYDGEQVRRFDREGVRDSGDDSHETHTHVSWYRDSEHRDKTSIFKRYFDGAASRPRLVPYPTLREHDSGPRVGHLQRALNAALGLDLAVDEDYGPRTTAGVVLLQRTADIDDDGIYGPDTAAALRDLLEDDMRLDDQLPVTEYTTDTWDREHLDVQTALSHTYVYARAASDRAAAAVAERAAQTALLRQIAAGPSGLTEDAIAAAVEEGVRAALPSADELAAAVAAAVDHDLDTAAVAAALREVLGGVDEAP